MSKPRVLDWLLLIYAVALVAAPHFLLSGTLGGGAATLMALFPSGFFSVALIAIVIRSIFPVLDFDFGHGFDRWFSLAFLLVSTSIFMGTLNFSGGMHLTMRNMTFLFPQAIVFLALAYAIAAVFLGWPMGPRRRKVVAVQGTGNEAPLNGE